MGFFKKLFTGIGFAAGFLFFGCLSVIVYASRGRHKPCHRRSSFWNTLERYLIFSWICDGVRSSRKRAEKSYYQRTGSDFWQTQTRVRPKSVKKCCSCGENTKAGGKKHEHRCNAVGETKENGASFCGTESIGSTKRCQKRVGADSGRA